VTFDHGKRLQYYAAMIERSAPFPPPAPGYDRAADPIPVPARFPDPRVPTEIPDVVLTGHDPTSWCAEFQ
jgi:3-phenylpropionate/trans-cinnamate dioxygenase ferredoxin reductase subunit